MKVEVGNKYHYDTYSARAGEITHYTKNIVVDKIYSGGIIGYKEPGRRIHKIVGKEHLKEGWIKDEKSNK